MVDGVSPAQPRQVFVFTAARIRDGRDQTGAGGFTELILAAARSQRFPNLSHTPSRAGPARDPRRRASRSGS